MAISYEQRQYDSYLGTGWAENQFTRTLELDQSGDIAVVSGVKNFSNAIFRRLKTPLGWYPEFPWYGSRLNEMIGMPNTYESRALIESWVEESLLYEARIINGSLKVSVEKDPSDYRAVDIIISCQLVNYPSSELFIYSFFLKTGDLTPIATE